MSVNYCDCGRACKPCAVLLVALVIVMIFGGRYAYTETKKSYREVGFNDGVVAANVEVIKLVREIGVEPVDCSLYEDRKLVELARAKSDSIYIQGCSGGIIF